jgi:hypothetical protein
VKTRAKRLALPLTGALATAAMVGSALALPAQAAPAPANDPLAAKKADAYAIANFWLNANGAALKKATQYTWDSKDVTKLVRSSGDTSDGKAGLVAPSGGKSGPAGKVKNVNLPRTIGKVFFVDGKGEYRWCSASSIQSRYRNLVATAGHCVYDTESNKSVMDKWVFIPGYYQGKTPWGIYVGHTAFTHYDLDTYEDFDADYAFVAVYNGFAFNGEKQVSKADWDKWAGDKWGKDVEISEADYKTCVDLHGGETVDCWAKASSITDAVGPDYKGAVKVLKEVTKEEYDKAPTGRKNGAKAQRKSGPEFALEHVTESQYKSYTGPGYRKIDEKGNFTITHYYLKYWVKESDKIEYFKTVFYVGLAKDMGRLGDVVGGQGVAWNQRLGQPTWVFGYPADPHPDGNKPYTGLTPKWCYGKTVAKPYSAEAYKVGNHIALKCAMTGGSDGSPWLVKYSNAKRLGYVNGVTSLFADQDGNDRVDYISSPYFDGETAAVYTKASNAVLDTRIVGPNGELLK